MPLFTKKNAAKYGRMGAKAAKRRSKKGTRFAIYDDNGSPYEERYGSFHKTRAAATRQRRALESSDVAGRHAFAVHKVPKGR